MKSRVRQEIESGLIIFDLNFDFLASTSAKLRKGNAVKCGMLVQIRHLLKHI